MAAAQAMAANQITVMRAGVWKPRTRPGAFEGAGAAAFPWLAAAKAATGIRIAIEVATPEHLELALKNNIDIVWLGARTTVSPFAVQDLADALQGTQLPVLVKNPINPDLELWIGAIERIAGAGITKIAGVHRGFSVYEKGPYRNKPNWELPIELRRRMPALPLFCDPSHIAGKASLVPQLAQKALDLAFDGLMLEVHPTPKTALSDARQQLSPPELAALLANLHVPQPEPFEAEGNAVLAELRADVDRVDALLIQALTDRMDLIQRLGALKREHQLAVLQPRRWAAMVHERLELARQAGLSTQMVLRLFQTIHQESISVQTALLHNLTHVD